MALLACWILQAVSPEPSLAVCDFVTIVTQAPATVKVNQIRLLCQKAVGGVYSGFENQRGDIKDGR
jgi:hypothetical protein